MPYITVMQTQRNHQVTLEDIIFDRVPFYRNTLPSATNGTVTFYTQRTDTLAKHMRSVHIPSLVSALEMFNQANEALFEAERSSLYHTFYIPKKSGGYRRIDEPNAELMAALRQLKAIFEERFNALYHTSAYAYVRGRCTVDAIKKHQRNRSKWFLKTDFSNFFGSTNEDFTWRMITQIFPFSEVVKTKRGEDALRKALNLGFLDGGLPQGTPLSPLLTNIIMIPFDHRVANELVKRGFVYTRYADDIQISHRENFNFKEVCDYIDGVLKDFDAPFAIKPTKTRYGSSSGRNWNLGVMLNGDNKITVGRKNKEYLKAACNNYITDRKRGVKWDPHDVCVLLGKMEYINMVEPDYIRGFLSWFNEKHNVNLKKLLREELR